MAENKVDTDEELSEEFTSRLDRDAIYRVKALDNAVRRAELHRNMKNDDVEVLAQADTYYDWLKGDGHSNTKSGMSPEKEQKRSSS